MTLIPPKEPAINRVIALGAARLSEGDRAGVEMAKSTVHVRSGDLQSTIRAIPPELRGDYIQGGIRAGGTADSGNTVDYAYEEELRHSFLRNAIGAIADQLHGA
jgi:hypothetical protein